MKWAMSKNWKGACQMLLSGFKGGRGVPPNSAKIFWQNEFPEASERCKPISHSC